MRLPILLCALLATITPGFAGDEPQPVTESEALAEVRAVLELALAKQPGLKADPADYRLRPASFSRATYGKPYTDLPAAKRKAVDGYAAVLMAALLHEAADHMHFKGKVPPLRCTGAAGGSPQVACSLPGKEYLYRVARTPQGGVEVVDVGADGLFLGEKLSAIWTAALARKPEGTTDSEALLQFVSALVEKTKHKARLAQAKDNLRSLIAIMLSRSIMRGWPPYGGKSFVLSVVAYGSLDVSQAENRAVLFGPSVPASERAKAAAYKAVTRATLAEGRDWSTQGLTTHAGRRNDEAKYKVTVADLKRDAVILADLTFEDVVIAGYTSGAVKVLTREDLGLGPKDPFTVGEQAKSELLKKLSLR